MIFFQKERCFFFKKQLANKHMFFMVDITKQKLCSKIMNAFLRRKKNVKSLFLRKTLTWAPYGYRYSPYVPGFDQSILKIFVINADSLFAKYDKLTTR